MQQKGLIEKMYIKPGTDAADYADEPNDPEWKSVPPKEHGEWRWVYPDELVSSLSLQILEFVADVQKPKNRDCDDYCR